MLRAARRTALVLATLGLTTGPLEAAPVCTDRLPGVNERCPAWTASYNHTGRGGRGEDIGRDIALSPDGGTVYISGESRDDGTLQDQAVAAFDAATGAQRWSSRSASPGFDTGSSVAASPDGKRVYAAGRSSGEGWDWVTTAYAAADGARLWEARLATELSDRTWAVAPSPDSSAVYVAGEVNGSDIGVAAYDAATGAEMWTAVYDGGGYDWALDMRVAPDGQTVYAAGTSSTISGTDLVVAAFRTSTEGSEDAGSLRWVRLVDGGTNQPETFAGFDLSDDGGSIAIGGFFTVPTAKAVTALLDAEDGAPRWVVLADGSPADGDVRDSVAISGDRVVRAAWAIGPAGLNSEYLTLSYRTSDGSLAWSAIHGTAQPYYKDHPKSVAFSPDGARVYVSGYALFPYGSTGQLFIEPGHILTMAYDAANGTRLWVAQHNQSGVGADVAVSILPSPDGQRLFLGGTFITSAVHVWASDLTMAYAYDFGVLAYPA